MAFKVEPIQIHDFDNLPDMMNYVKNEDERLTSVPVSNFIKNKARFQDDYLFGSGETYVNFNEEGFKAFCSLCKIPFDFINDLNEKNLISSVLNNWLSKPRIKEILNKYRFVLDEEKMTVMGVVSETYLGYSNNTFIKDLYEKIPEIKVKFHVERSYVINSNFYLRLLSNDIMTGIVKGQGGEGPDKSKVGLQLSNSMIGQSSIKASFFVYRLVCANGLVMQSSNESGIVKHSGKEETLQKRIETNIKPIVDSIKTVPKLIETLGNINFDVERIVKVGGAKKVYDIISLSSTDQKKRQNLKGNKLEEFDIQRLSEYTFNYSGEHSKQVFQSRFRNNQNMFDFINLFTEYAHQFPPKRRIEIEEKSGQLANWILENKKKFK